MNHSVTCGISYVAYHVIHKVDHDCEHEPGPLELKLRERDEQDVDDRRCRKRGEEALEERHTTTAMPSRIGF